MGSRFSRTKVEPAVPNIAHIRRSTSTKEGNRQSTASSESGGKAPDDRTQVKSDCDDGARRLRDPNRVATKETFDDSQHEVAPCHECHPELSTKADTKGNRISQRNLEAGDGNKPSRGRSVPPNPSRGADRDITTRATDQLSGKPSGGDEAAKWKEKYRALKEENQAKHEKLRKSNETLKEACGKARKNLDDERQLAHNTTQRLQGELQHYKRELEELHTSHIRSVNDVGTGLEPISDQEFQKRIRSLHDEGGSWCRKAFKQRTIQDINPPEALDEQLLTIIVPRVVPDANPSFAQIIEMVVWGFVENHIFSVLFPGLPPELMEKLSVIHSVVIDGDHSGTYDRSEFWRAYTASLMLQNTAVKKYLSTADDQPAYVIALLYALQTIPVELDRLFYDKLGELLFKARTLSAEMKCQRGLYEVDHNIQVGDAYDEATMADIGFDDLDEEREAVVTAIITKGIVKRLSPGSKQVVQLAKARVLVGMK